MSLKALGDQDYFLSAFFFSALGFSSFFLVSLESLGDVSFVESPSEEEDVAVEPFLA